MPDIELPIPKKTPGPQWAQMLVTAIDAVNDATDTSTEVIEDGRLSEDALNLTIAEVAGGLVKAGDAWVAEVLGALAAEDVPTITVSTSSAIAGTNVIGASTDLTYDPHFRYDNVATLSDRGSGYVNSTTTPGVNLPEFITDPDNAEIEARYKAFGTDFRIRVEVDGVPHQLPLQGPFMVADDAYLYARIQFPSARARRLKLWSSGQDEFGGVKVAAGQTVRRPAGEWNKRLAIVGDSYVAGGPGPSNPLRLETFVYFLGKLLECDSIVNLGIGGTGWANPNGAQGTFLDRTPLALSFGPSVLGYVGSRNDIPSVLSGIGKTLNDAIANAVAGVGMASAVPFVFMAGPVTNPGTEVNQVNAALRSAATIAGVPYVDLRGTEGTPVDGHATFAQTQVIAKAIYAALDRPDVDERVSAARASRLAATLTLVASPSGAAAVGANVTLTATLGTHLAGRVSFFVDGVKVGSATVTTAVASLTVSTIAAGTHTIQARFEPSSPAAVKAVASNVITGYVVSANLGHADDFERADGSLGSTTNGKAWTSVGTGTWSIASGKALNTGATGNAFAIIDDGTPNGTVKWIIAGTPAAGYGVGVARYSDVSNHLYINLNGTGGRAKLWKRVANASTQLTDGSGGTAVVAGDLIELVMSGDTLTLKQNGTVIGTATDAAFNTLTKSGMFVSSAGLAIQFGEHDMVAA